jgi:hypothetical protein
MNFKTLFFSVFFFSCALTAQVKEFSLPLTSAPRLVGGTAESTDTLVPPFVDDFSYPNDRPSSTLWQDQKVLINDEYALFQNSVGVATFDGLSEYGFAYKPGSLNSDSLADVLTSAYLNLNGMNNVWLSFQYQRAGTGEAPSETDSLVVEYWSPVTQTWEYQWGVTGTGGSTPFRSAIMPVVGANYLRNGFAFRIASYGARSGAYDIWNIDYVQLDKDRTDADTIITEPAFARAHPLMIGSGAYTSWPWWVSSASAVNNSPTTLEYIYRRNGVVPPGGWSLNLGQYRWEENGVLISQSASVAVVTNTSHNIDQTFTLDVPFNALGVLNGPTTATSKIWFDGSAAGFRSNDTVYQTLKLDNYLALDDGTAERAYAVQNISGARVAQRFQTQGLGITDSLKGVRFNFVDAGDRYASTFRLAVWATSDSVGAPGEMIYLSDSLYEPNWGYYRGDMIPYELDSAIAIGTYTHIWVGYVCTSADPLYVGFDVQRELPNAMPRFYGDGFNWYPSLEPGVMMMQPYFNYTQNDMGLSIPAVAPKLYPNPSRGILRIDAAGANIQLFDLQGKLVFNGICPEDQPLDLQHLPSGMYTVVCTDSEAIHHMKWMKL